LLIFCLFFFRHFGNIALQDRNKLQDVKLAPVLESRVPPPVADAHRGSGELGTPLDQPVNSESALSKDDHDALSEEDEH
jgi:hypothetical protein